MRLHIVTDRTTGESRVRGRDGNDYTLDEIDVARRRAASGDAVARAFLDGVELPKDFKSADLIHDCPECRAAMERGEKPVFATPSDIARVNRHGFFRKRPRWRHLKRVVRR